MTLIGALGKETSRTLQDQDVSQSTVDLAARTAALQTSVVRLRALLSKSANVSALLAVESQLSDRESELESLVAQKNALAGQVSLATLTVSLKAKPAPAVVARKKPAGIHPTGFVSALGSGLHAVGVWILLMLAGLGYALPVLVPLGLLAALIWWLRRRFLADRAASE